MVSVRGKIVGDFSISTDLVNDNDRLLAAGINQKIEFQCSRGHRYSIQPHKKILRGTGCQVCKRNKNNFLDNFKDPAYREKILLEWMEPKNEGIQIIDLTRGSEKLYWWKCVVCDYEFQQHSYNRSRGVGCPNCAGKILNEENNLKARFPLIETIWSEKNKLGPDHYFPFTENKFYFVCPRNKSHEYERMISSVSRDLERIEDINNISCAICSNKIVLKKQSAGHLFPDLVDYWKSDANEKTIYEVSPGSDYYATWQCTKEDCSHVWKAYVHNRVRSVYSCPRCVRRPVYYKYKQKEVYAYLEGFMQRNGRIPKVNENSEIRRLYYGIIQNHQYWGLRTSNYWFECLLEIITNLKDTELKAILEIELETKLMRYTKRENRMRFDQMIQMVNPKQN